MMLSLIYLGALYPEVHKNDGYLLLASTKISMEYMESSGKKELKEIEKDW